MAVNGFLASVFYIHGARHRHSAFGAPFRILKNCGSELKKNPFHDGEEVPVCLYSLEELPDHRCHDHYGRATSPFGHSEALFVDYIYRYWFRINFVEYQVL